MGNNGTGLEEKFDDPFEDAVDLWGQSNGNLDRETAEQVIELLDQHEGRKPTEESAVVIDSLSLEMRGDALRVLGDKEGARRCYLLAAQLYENNPQREEDKGYLEWAAELRAKAEALS